MSASLIALRLVTLFLLLAGILLLRKPVFGQPITAAPAKSLSVLGQRFPIMDTCSPLSIEYLTQSIDGTEQSRKTYLAG
jgi:hypothetical protein